MRSTPVFSGLATTPTNKSEELGLAPNSLQPYAMSPSHSLNTPGTRSTTTCFNTLTYTLHTTAMWTTVTDNRFIVHNEHFLHHPAMQTLIHHNFFGDPVELEPVDDFHLLGFNIDLQQRTITDIQPSQPWKIRDSTTAGSQRLALSGLQSRLHTIFTIKYTFPPSSAEAAAAELVRLYVQKGHNHKACHRFLKKAPMTATCACQPLGQGFTTATSPTAILTTVSPAGGMAAVSLAMPTKLWDSAGRECGCTFLYLQRERFFKLSNLIGLLSWSFMLPPSNRFISHFQQPRFFAACRRSCAQTTC